MVVDVQHSTLLILVINPKAAIPSHYGKLIGKSTDGSDFKAIIEEENSDIQVELKL